MPVTSQWLLYSLWRCNSESSIYCIIIFWWIESGWHNHNVQAYCHTSIHIFLYMWTYIRRAYFKAFGRMASPGNRIRFHFTNNNATAMNWNCCMCYLAEWFAYALAHHYGASIGWPAVALHRDPEGFLSHITTVILLLWFFFLVIFHCFAIIQSIHNFIIYSRCVQWLFFFSLWMSRRNTTFIC